MLSEDALSIIAAMFALGSLIILAASVVGAPTAADAAIYLVR